MQTFKAVASHIIPYSGSASTLKSLTPHSFQNKGVGDNLSLVTEVQRGS